MQGSHPDYFSILNIDCAGSLIPVHAQMGGVSHLDLGHRPFHSFGKLDPELPGIRLWLGDRRPIVADMLVLASNLTGMTATTLRYINHKHFLC
jgi:hypothetical protein